VAKGCRVVDELNLLLNISYTLESSLELREVIRPVLLKMEELMGLKCGTITILDRKGDGFSASEAVGLPRHLSKEEYLQHHRPLIDDVVRTGQAVVVPDVSTDPLLKREGTAEVEGKTAFICVPVKFGEEVVGCLSAERPSQAEVSLVADRRLLSLVANVIAQSVQFHRLTEERLKALRTENERLQEQLQTSLRPPNMIGNSSAMRSVYRHMEQVANSTTTVLIRGESGVGKELVAHALHEQSPRKGKAFVKFNCAALPESIIESELFGHEKGAFTGAISMRKGRFEIANGGTIFLDEIGDLSLPTQIKLLRVLQEKEFERVGNQTPIRSDVRVITATSRNLEEMIEREKFRSDLYYRLNVFPIYVPPLRERKSDVLLLADHFVEKYAKQNQKSIRRISTAAIDLLTSYHWPGNVRELENCIERAVLLCQDKAIEAHHLPPTLQKKDSSEKSLGGTLESAMTALAYEMIVAELKATDGNMAAAARNLGLTERQIGLRVKRFGIDFKRFRRGDESAATKVTSA
jgi:Nif-specific regulatory protein